MKDEERKELELERDARRELLKRLAHPLELVKKAAAKEKDKRVAQIERLKKYDNYEEAHDAWGWDMISDEELEAARVFFEQGEKFINDTVSVAEAAESLLRQFMSRLRRELSGIEFELLPPAEQIRQLEAEEKRKKENEKQKQQREVRK